MTKKVLTPLSGRFWGKVDKSGECWVWVAGKSSQGYGQIAAGRRGSKMLKAHRVSWELHFGEIPDGVCVLHKCDNPACVRPGHLFLGTQQDNVTDMMQKGRQGKTGPQAGAGAKLKLTPKQVQSLRAEGYSMSQQKLAAKYGIGQNTVSRILRGVSASKL